ncbi:MAG: biotin/lipoyl-containing protein [Planctomycetota bacterium]|mgnify:FL=1
MKKLKITVSGKVYEVLVEILEDEVQAPPAPPKHVTPPPGQGEVMPVTIAPVHAAQKAVHSPLSGRVVALSVQVGQSVKEGDRLMLLEAMKMNNYVYAPQSGQIASILVKVDDAVEEGQPLILFS